MAGERADQPLLAHSPPAPGREGDPYSRHVEAVRNGALERAAAALKYAPNIPPSWLAAIEDAAVFHDLGKLDSQNQAALRRGRTGKLVWDHIDAGVAHLSKKEIQDWTAAWLVRAHHAPGLPCCAAHFDPDGLGHRLRGRRRDDDQDPRAEQRHQEQIKRTDEMLPKYMDHHVSSCGEYKAHRQRPEHGLRLRLALSCLVDADHADTAWAESRRLPPPISEPRWAERLDQLCRYVRELSPGDTPETQQRNARRAAFFEACLQSDERASMVACEGPVGIGKTTAVTAYLLRQCLAASPSLRRIIIVAPYTNILTQTAERLRAALVLPGEVADQVIVEHHHRADFTDLENRELAVLWQAPIVLTTAVSFFESLAACNPGALRKLHALPGSAVFLDEAHAALPVKLWPQNWLWLQELFKEWGCRFVFASGTLVRFWEESDIVVERTKLPELLPQDQAQSAFKAEQHRVKYKQWNDGSCITVNDLVEAVHAAPGPRLVILNTVQNAAVVAEELRKRDPKALHLSTALAPRDRARILARIQDRLGNHRKNWTLVATSCVEAGVDFSFRTAFRERFAIASTLQVGGRVNRHGEFDPDGGSVVYDFALDDKDRGITTHPAARASAPLLDQVLRQGRFSTESPADLVTWSMKQEIARVQTPQQLRDAEAKRDYPTVAELGRIIDSDTRLVVVSKRLEAKLKAGVPVNSRMLLEGSVQLWAQKVDRLDLEPIPHRGREIFAWPYQYDPQYLGIMKGMLQLDRFWDETLGII